MTNSERRESLGSLVPETKPVEKKFRTPRRRATRQRSGFSVGGDKTGSEVIIIRAQSFFSTQSKLAFKFERVDCPIPGQFGTEDGMVATGGYFKTSVNCQLTLTLEVIEPLDGTIITSKTKTEFINANKWSKHGIDSKVEIASAYDAVNIRAVIAVEAESDQKLGTIQVLGIDLNSVTAYSDKGSLDDYSKKTHLFYPEIYYLEHHEPFAIEPSEIEGEYIEDLGEQVVLKACNRCSRFLPIDIADERYAIGFSNHCVQRAPCTHTNFSEFRIQNWENLDSVDEAIKPHLKIMKGAGYVTTFYGFQLECRPCKKFTVNAPLNPLRNTAQRREDSLRRRAAEQLVMHLLNKEWIFYSYRQNHQREFDGDIWLRFDKRCFSCGKELANPKEMDLDHTMPLVYLWPLDNTATCLCSTCNAQKHDLFPFEFPPYQQPGKLEALANITGLDVGLLTRREKRANPKAVSQLRKEVKWFFDEFLNHPDYQKIRHGKKAADLILASIQRILNETNSDLNLINEYIRLTGRFPSSVSSS